MFDQNLSMRGELFGSERDGEGSANGTIQPISELMLVQKHCLEENVIA